MDISLTGADKARVNIEKIKEALSPENCERIVDRVAQQTLKSVVEATPKGWTGNTRRGWHVTKPAPQTRVIVNNSPVIVYLDQGTRAHGPVFKQFLYIPLTRRAIRWFPGLVRGVDFILKKWVAGIKALRFMEKEREKARGALKTAFKDAIRGALHGG